MRPQVTQGFSGLAVIAAQSDHAPGHLEVYAMATAGQGSDAAGPLCSVEVTPDAAVTALAVGPHGLAWAQATGRVCLEAHDFLRCLEGTESASFRMTFWAGARVTALSWRSRNTLLIGDDHGRLMTLGIESPQSVASAIPGHVASVGCAWLAFLPMPGARVAAVSVRGHLLIVDDNGSLLSEKRLPFSGSAITAVQYCPGLSCLVYQTSTQSEDGRTESVSRQWHAWCTEGCQAIPLPDVLRYADRLVAYGRGLLAFSNQGMSWQCPMDSARGGQVLEEVTARLAAPCVLGGWLAGPCGEVVTVNNEPMVLRIDPQGRPRVVVLRDETWHPAYAQLPEARYCLVSIAESSAFESAARARREEHAGQLTEQAMRAYAEGRVDESRQMLEQLDTTCPGQIRGRVLRARIELDRGDPLAALTHLRQAVSPPVDCPSGLLAYYVRLLTRVGAWDELAGFDLDAWPTLTRRLPTGQTAIDVSMLRRCLIAPPLSTQTHLGAGISRGLDNAAVHQLSGFGLERGHSDFSEHDACPVPESIALGWACVRRWGTCGPYWLGTDRLPSLPLFAEDADLFNQSMVACGAAPRRLTVFNTDGPPQVASGWVFRDVLSPHPMQRQLVAWQDREPGNTIAMCWAVSAERYLPPAAWDEAWQATHDPCWRSDMEGRIAVVRESLRCGLVPDPALLGRRHIRTRNTAANTPEIASQEVSG